jgi:hypothetical protein
VTSLDVGLTLADVALPLVRPKVTLVRGLAQLFQQGFDALKRVIAVEQLDVVYLSGLGIKL